MKIFPKEYRPLLGTAIACAACISGGAAFLWHSLQESQAAIQLLEKRSAEINRFRNATPSPSGEQLKQLQQQLAAVESKYLALREKVGALDKFPVVPVSPQEFQKALNDRVQSLQKKAEKNSVTLPLDKDQSTENYFYLGWSDYKSKPPSPESAPGLLRQLQVTEHLIGLLLDTQPLAIKKIRLYKPEAPPAPTAASGAEGKPAPGVKTDPKKDGPPPADSMPSTIQPTQGYELSFSARPESLREFLNALTAEQKAFFVTRTIKVANNKEKEPPKKGVDATIISGPLSAPGSLLAGNASSGAVGAGLGGIGQQNPEENAAKFILGDEFVEVDMNIELLALREPATAKDTPKRP